ncbi:MAG: hypothetical protein WCV56_06340 [Candidatus Omnitrophota bacterium]
METFKNFVIGVSVLAMALVIILLTLLAWPFMVGITSVVLFVFAVFLFIIAVFYIVVLIGHLTRMLISAMKKDRAS